MMPVPKSRFQRAAYLRSIRAGPLGFVRGPCRTSTDDDFLSGLWMH